MNDILDLLVGSKGITLITTVISMYATLVAVYITFLKSRKIQRVSNIDKSYELLLKGIEQKTLDEESIRLIYNDKIARKYNIPFVQYLESFIIHVREKDDEGNLTKQLSAIIIPIIQKERKEKPYLNLDEKNRHLLQALEESVKHSEMKAFSSLLTDLSLSIESDQKALLRARITSRVATVISIIGLALTLFIWLYGSRLSDADVKRISSEISTNILQSQTAQTIEEVIIE